MCCDLCDLYEKCQEVVTPEAVCCTECAESSGCGGGMMAGRHIMDDEDFDDSFDDGEEDSLDYDDDDLDYDDDDFDDDYDDDINGDYESRH
jgi:hypothetical protein